MITSGRTKYIVVGGSSGKEVWGPKGVDVSVDGLYCWKSKLDSKSGKIFYVNVAGFGKKWKLPDISDALYQQQLRLFSESQEKREVRRQRSMDFISPIAQPPSVSPVHVAQPVVVPTPPEEEIPMSYKVQPESVFLYDDAVFALEEQRSVARGRQLEMDTFMKVNLEKERLMISEGQLRHKEGQPIALSLQSPFSSGFSTPVPAPLQHVKVDTTLLHHNDVVRLIRQEHDAMKQHTVGLLEALEQRHNSSPQLPSPSPPRRSAEPEQQLSVRQRDDATTIAHLSSVIATLQAMLDEERGQNLRLQRMVEERERILLERNLADAEQEQRELSMKLRMTEAIAAYRKEQEILQLEAAESTIAQDGILRQTFVRK